MRVPQIVQDKVRLLEKKEMMRNIFLTVKIFLRDALGSDLDSAIEDIIDAQKLVKSMHDLKSISTSLMIIQEIERQESSKRRSKWCEAYSMGLVVT